MHTQSNEARRFRFSRSSKPIDFETYKTRESQPSHIALQHMTSTSRGWQIYALIVLRACGNTVCALPSRAAESNSTALGPTKAAVRSSRFLQC